jgi:alcohol dehydrogenase
VVHGQAIALMLPHVIRFNGAQHGRWYRDLLECSANGAPQPDAGATGLAEYVLQLTVKAGLRTRLSECGVAYDDLPAMATDAAKQWTGGFNPRPVTEDDLLKLYQSAY